MYYRDFSLAADFQKNRHYSLDYDFIEILLYGQLENL